MVLETQTPPFWPSRRLLVRLFWASICIPLLVQLCVISFVGAVMFGNKVAVFLFFVTLIAGSTLNGMLLALSWRGLGAGLLATACMFVAWYLVTSIMDDLRLGETLEEALIFTLVAGSGVSVVKVVARDIHGRGGFIGLLIGIVAGFFLSVIYAHIFVPVYGRGPRVNELFLLGWSAYFALVWISAHFFPELLAQRVGGGGALIWAGLVVMIFGVSMLLMQ